MSHVRRGRRLSAGIQSPPWMKMSRPLTLNMKVLPGSEERGRWITVIVRIPNFLEQVSSVWPERIKVAVTV